MTCDKCGSQMNMELELTGGCGGYHGEDNRCYCDSPDVKCYWRCANQNTKTAPRGRLAKFCHATKPIYELGDQYAIARWLRENYEGIFMRAAREAAAREREETK